MQVVQVVQVKRETCKTGKTARPQDNTIYGQKVTNKITIPEDYEAHT
jgi:hypothetical protein